jgi:phage-related minor tail protein
MKQVNQTKGESMKQEQDIERYKSQIERQCEEMQATIDLLKATVETLCLRLKPVMVDAPVRYAADEVSPVASPLGGSIFQYRMQTSDVIDEMVQIIERLEI